MTAYVSRDGLWRVEPIVLTLTSDPRADGEYLRVTYRGFHHSDIRVTRDAENPDQLSFGTMLALGMAVPVDELSVALTVVQTNPEGNHQ
jgi:hypothetical protein